MPSDWINQKATQEQKLEAESNQRKELQQREADLIKALAPELVKKLMSTINDDIVAWNAAFRDRQINGASEITNGFRIAKEGFPRGVAEITFNPPVQALKVRLERSTGDGSGMYETLGKFELHMNPDGKGIHITDRGNAHIEFSGVSRIILESIAEARSQHLI